MKNIRNRLIPLILLLAIIVIAVTSCGSSTSIVGKWQPLMEEDQYMEFFSDGRIQLEDGINTFTGTYELDGDQVVITIEGMFEESGEPAIAIATYIIDGDIMTFIQGESSAKFIRVD